MIDNVDETELIIRVSNNDRSAFTILYSQYINGLYRYVYLFTKSKDLSEEIIQNVFIKIWAGREMLPNVSSFRAYVFKIARNLVLDEIRRKQIQARALVAITPTSEESSDVTDGRLIYSQYYQIAQDAINLLPEKRKKIVELRTKEELSLDEIAEKLSISKNVVKKQLYTGLNFIKAQLQKHGEFTHLLIPFLFLVDENNNLLF